MKELEACDMVQITIGSGRTKFYMLIDRVGEEMWLDTKILPHSAFICAAVDGIVIRQAGVGPRETIQRRFVPMLWVMNEWGGDPEIVAEVKKRYEMICKDLPRLRKEHWEKPEDETPPQNQQ